MQNSVFGRIIPKNIVLFLLTILSLFCQNRLGLTSKLPTIEKFMKRSYFKLTLFMVSLSKYLPLTPTINLFAIETQFIFETVKIQFCNCYKCSVTSISWSEAALQLLKHEFDYTVALIYNVKDISQSLCAVFLIFFLQV